MAAPQPLNSLLGGLTLAIPVHSLMLLNGNVFGISGFIHRAARGASDALSGVAGLILGGTFVGFIENTGPEYTSLSISQLAAAGFLVGFGTKLSNGCTSGHMVCGMARLSIRSIVATAAFFSTGVITAHIFHNNLGPTAPPDWSFGVTACELLAAQLVPFTVSILLYFFPPLPKPSRQPIVEKADAKTPPKEISVEYLPQPLLRHLAFFSTTTQFGLAVHLSGLTNPNRVLRFLLLPFNVAFDPSLAFLAAGTIPLSMSLYHFARGKEIPRLGGKWSIPKASKVDLKLVGGAAIFGVGWGLAGICPGPGLVTLGRALTNNHGQLSAITVWLIAVVAGGLLA